RYSYSVTLAPNTLRLFKGSSVLETDATLSASANTSYVLRIEAEGSTIRGFFGGALTLSTTDATYTDPNVGICARWPDASNRGRVYSFATALIGEEPGGGGTTVEGEATATLGALTGAA